VNISRIKIPLFIVASILVISVIILIVTITITNKASKLQYYDVEGDSIPSITNVIGERKVSGKSSKVSNSVLYKRYSYYGMDSAIEDIQKYINYLSENDSFTIYSQLDSNVLSGQISLSKKSLKTGKDILLTIEYEVGRYTISIEKVLN
jgi:hypothetical protein